MGEKNVNHSHLKGFFVVFYCCNPKFSNRIEEKDGFRGSAQRRVNGSRLGVDSPKPYLVQR